MSFVYSRTANYYETHMRGIVHHSNRIRYFEEARIAFMRSIDCDVMQMEKDGIIIPNVDAYARYYIPVRFSEEIDIEVRLSYFNGTKMEYTYTAKNKNGETAAEGHTMHCFVRGDFKPMSLRRTYPEYYKKLAEAVEK